jgi:hypothetical protein
MPPNKPLSFCYSELPSEGRKLCITFTPITLKIILCFTPHSPQHECLGLATLSIKKAPDGSDKSVTCSITWTLKPGNWILIRFPCLASSFIVTEIKVTIRNTTSTRFPLTVCFVFELLTLQDQWKDYDNGF